MLSLSRAQCALLFLCLLAFVATTRAADTPGSANSDPVYQQLRNIGLGTEAVSVSNVEIKRDAATFHLTSGTVCFVAPVQGKVTGAVFVGEGTMTLVAPSADEKRSLRLLTREDSFNESFTRLALRFTDTTYDELKKAGGAATVGCEGNLLQESQQTMRKKLSYNLTARILADVLRDGTGGLFVAFVHGKHYEDKLLYFVDPNGAPGASPDEVELMTYSDDKSGVWAAFHYSSEYRQHLGAASQNSSRIHIEHQVLDTTIEGNANLIGKATTSFVSLVPGLRVVEFAMFPTLRVQSVKSQDGQPVSFIQENKNEDPGFYVVLPKALSKGEKYEVSIEYSGKDAVKNEGSGNYYPVARESWYPGNAGAGLSDYTQYDMTFRVPKALKMAATGSLISEKVEGGLSVTVWKSDIAQAVAGFQFGRMKEEDVKLTTQDFLVAAYANEDPPDWAAGLRGGTMGNLSTVSMMKGPLSEARFAVTLYGDYFGQLPFKRLNLTQQTACTYGQSWPGLVWLPICSFYDTTVRHQLGFSDDRGYWDVVTPHEVAHQWWGQVVGFHSYRDQWMSEGFADFSASLFLQGAYGDKGKKMFMKFWEDERKTIVEKNRQGFRAIDVGPVTMGYRLDNSKAGFDIYRSLIYAKGAYILHMVRMMMWSQESGDTLFKETMRDFVKTYSGRSATTEDFKAIVEKHMPDTMKSFGSGSLDWFFNEYVYGTALPQYTLDTATFDADPTGKIILNIKLTQSGVDENFRMMVPIYLELADGKVTMLGRARLIGNSSFEQKISLGGVKDKPRRVILNYYNDVLAAN